MKSVSELVADAQALAAHVAIGKKLASDLATNVGLAGRVLTADNLDTIRQAYSQADMLETSRELDKAIDDAKARGQ